MTHKAVALYDIEQALAVVADEIQLAIDAGQEPPPEALERLAAWVTMERHKADGAAAFLTHLRADAERCEELAARQKERAARLMRARKKVEEHIILVLTAAGRDSVRGVHHNIRIQASPEKLEIEDENELPVEFLETHTTTSVNRDAVKAALKRGEEVPGARITRGRHLRVET